MKLKKGYLYAATEQKYVDEATRSLRSLRAVDKNAHATLISDLDTEADEFDSIIKLKRSTKELDKWEKGLLFKIQAIQNSPYEKTFFLDSDTFFCDSCRELFELLEYFELLIAYSPGDVNQIEENNRILDGYFPYNTGVIVYRNTKATALLFKEWYTEYESHVEDYQDDQAAFMKAMLHNNVKSYVLQPIYNLRTMFYVSVPETKVKLIHGRSLEFDKINKIINEKIVHRVWDPAYEKIHFRKSTPLIKRFVYNHTPKPLLKFYSSLKHLIK